MERKYLIIKDPVFGCETVLTFTAHADHSFMAENKQVVSAGKFTIYPACPPSAPNPQISVIHGSTTLKIERDVKREDEDHLLLVCHLRPEY